MAHVLTLLIPLIQVPPHLFAASDAAYQQMMNNTKDQAMLVRLFRFVENGTLIYTSRSLESLGPERPRTQRRSSLTLPSLELPRERRRRMASRQRRRKPIWRTGLSTPTQFSNPMAMPKPSGTTTRPGLESSSGSTSTTWENWLEASSTFTSWRSRG